MQIRLIRGTTVITDEILTEERPYERVITYHEGPGCG